MKTELRNLNVEWGLMQKDLIVENYDCRKKLTSKTESRVHFRKIADPSYLGLT